MQTYQRGSEYIDPTEADFERSGALEKSLNWTLLFLLVIRATNGRTTNRHKTPKRFTDNHFNERLLGALRCVEGV